MSIEYNTGNLDSGLDSPKIQRYEEFAKGASFSLAAYSLYLLTTSAAYAADSNVPAPGARV